MGKDKRWIVINERNETIIDEGWEWCQITNADLITFRVRDKEVCMTGGISESWWNRDSKRCVQLRTRYLKPQSRNVFIW